MQKKEYEDDVLMLGGHPFHSRFILGSGKFSLSLIQTVMEYGGSEIATIALRRANADSKENILDFLPKNITLLPNTSGARNAEEAIRIARLSRELGCGDFVKVEIIHETKYLLPDNEETIRATRQLAKRRLYCPAVYVSGFGGCSEAGRCRCGCHYAARCTDWQQSGLADKRLYSHFN